VHLRYILSDVCHIYSHESPQKHPFPTEYLSSKHCLLLRYVSSSRLI
jgi:hypothetical protein